ncbi:MAG: hypothetical protein II336_04405 [Loktanella sp.]|nr:hypothetical protein [Loktanella sp.]
MNKIFATTAFALTIAAGAASAQTDTLTGANEVTCAEFLAMDVADQELMLTEIVTLSDGGSAADTDLGAVAIACTGNDDVPVVDALDS